RRVEDYRVLLPGNDVRPSREQKVDGRVRRRLAEGDGRERQRRADDRHAIRVEWDDGDSDLIGRAPEREDDVRQRAADSGGKGLRSPAAAIVGRPTPVLTGRS